MASHAWASREPVSMRLSSTHLTRLVLSLKLGIDTPRDLTAGPSHERNSPHEKSAWPLGRGAHPEAAELYGAASAALTQRRGREVASITQQNIKLRHSLFLFANKYRPRSITP